MSFLFLFVSSSVHADLTNYPTEQEVKQYQKDNYQRIKEEILNQGYSEEQFKAMMNMPYLQPEEDVSQFYKDSQNSSRVKRSTNLQEAVVNEAKKYLGRPYGLDEPRELTCDRLVLYAYKATNIDVPRLTTNQEKLGVEVSLNNLQKGDLIFWRDNGVTYHVAIYVGDNQYIHAPDYGQNVQINSINPYFKPSFARRILPTDNGKEPNNNGQKTGEQYIHRLYNMNEGQHHYTGALFEA
ncbi:MAG: C40 family peptidase [Staphylococcus equorum]|nr:C40 family peptidase [Staphylococcus equorum]